MKTFRRYLLYLLKNSLIRTVIFALLSLIFTWRAVQNSGYVEPSEYIQVYKESGLGFLAFILAFFASLIPILELASLKNRRNLDTLYFFPLARWKFALAHYLSGWIQTVAIYTVCFVAAVFTWLPFSEHFKLIYTIPYYFLSLLVGLMIYSVFSFLFIQGNSVVDGLLFCVMWIFGLYLPVGSLHTFCSDALTPWMSWTLLYSPINNLTVIFIDLIEYAPAHNYFPSLAADFRENAILFLPWALIGVGAILGYFLTFVKRGAEKTGEISDSWFGYRVLIPLYGYSIMLAISSSIYLNIFVLLAMVVGYLIYRRGVKLKLSDYIMTGIGFLLLVLLGILDL